MLLRGEAGVGKTAVIRHFIAGLDERVRVLEDCGPCPQLAWSLVNLAQLATAALRAVNVEDAAPCHHRHDVRSGRISGTAGSQSRCAAWIRALTLAEDSSRRGLPTQPQVHSPLLL